MRSVDKIISFVAGLKLPKASLDLAKDDLLRANDLQPGNKTTCLLLAKIYLALGDNTEALDWIWKAENAKSHGIEGSTVCAKITKLKYQLINMIGKKK